MATGAHAAPDRLSFGAAKQQDRRFGDLSKERIQRCGADPELRDAYVATLRLECQCPAASRGCGVQNASCGLAQGSAFDHIIEQLAYRSSEVAEAIEIGPADVADLPGFARQPASRIACRAEQIATWTIARERVRKTERDGAM
jgi:hypothetical protein